MSVQKFIRSPKELALAVASQRRNLKISQDKAGELVGLKQATLSAFENKPESTKLETLFRILSAVDLELYIAPKNEKNDPSSQWPHEW